MKESALRTPYLLAENHLLPPFNWNSSRSLILRSALFFCLILGAYFPALALPEESSKSATAAEIRWQEVEPGYSFARVELGEPEAMLKSEILLLKFDPKRFQVQALPAKDFGKDRTDLKTLTIRAGGIAGINANFFDESGLPLGLLIQSKQVRNKMHKGGSLLTGVFLIGDTEPRIVHRDDFKEESVDFAIQSGPRLIADSRPLSVSAANQSSRRSGIAITKEKHVIIFATLLRFPGASLAQIQNLLLTPSLGIVDALNLDGGGSSQLYIQKNLALSDDTFITGGDLVPVGLVVKRAQTDS